MSQEISTNIAAARARTAERREIDRLLEESQAAINRAKKSLERLKKAA